MPTITKENGVDVIHLDGYSTDASSLTDQYYGLVLKGLCDISFVAMWDIVDNEVKYYSPTGQLPEGLPAIDDTELLFRLAEYERVQYLVEYRDASPDEFSGFMVQLYAFVTNPGAHVVRIDEQRPDYQWSYLVDVGDPHGDKPRLVPGTVYHFGPDKDAHKESRLSNYDEVVALMSHPDAVRCDSNNWPASFDGLDGKIVVWDLTDAQLEFDSRHQDDD